LIVTKGGSYFLETVEIAKKVVTAALDKQAADIVLLDTRRVCSFADYFVICSGDSQRYI
jgi:ribosome-associated protein